MRILAVLLAISFASGGCYLGSTRSQKTATYVANGVLAVAGAVMMLPPSGPDPCAGRDGCWSGGDITGTLVGGTLVSVAVVGTLIALVAPTRPDDTKPVARTRAPVTGTITTPGLRPAAVQLR